MDEIIVHQRNKHFGPSRHGRVDRVGPEPCAVNAVTRIRGGAPYHIAGVDILDIDLDFLFFKIVFDLLLEERPDVAEFLIA